VQLRHGGRAWGPVPRSYGYALPHKVRKTALISALRRRAGEGAVLVYEPSGAAKPSTKAMAAALSAMGVTGKALLVAGAAEHVVTRSARNLPYVTVLTAAGINVYDIVNAAQVVFTPAALAQLDGVQS